MKTQVFESLADLDQFYYEPWGPPPVMTSPQFRVLAAPYDRIHEANLAVLNSARFSLAGAMYGFTDEEAGKVIQAKLADDNVFCQLTFDSSQAAGPTQRAMFEELGLLDTNSVVPRVVTGTSEHGKIIHDKTWVIDGRFVVTGSTNLSLSGEQLQCNQYVVIDDHATAARVRVELDRIHTKCLTAMQAKAAKP